MSALSAIFNRRGAPVSAEAVTSMLEAQAARGPDARRVWAQGEIALGHGLLATTAEDGLAPQPFCRAGGALVVSLDGRLDNRSELASSLGIAEQATSDVELVAEAYAHWGASFAERLEGDFAAVLWDACKRTLVCARDPLAGRPLYYSADGRTFRCASNPWALFAKTGEAPVPDLDAVALFLVERYVERRFTLFQGVQALEPGTTLFVTRTAFQLAPSSWPGKVSTRTFRAPSEYNEHLFDALHRAVGVRMRARGRVAVHVSGGIDSSSVAAIAAEIARERGEIPPLLVRCTFPDLACDETPFSDAVARHLGLPIESAVLPGELADYAPEPARVPRGVISNPIPTMLTRMIDLAKARGVRVTLTGAGSDQLLQPTGFELSDALLHGDVRRVAELSGLRNEPFSFAAWQRLARVGAVRALPPRFRRRVRALLGRPDGLPEWLAPRACASVQRLTQVPPDLCEGDFPSQSVRKLVTQMAHDSDYSYSSVLVDHLAAARGAELRHPFLDRRVIELLLSFPDDQRSAAPPLKALLRRAMGHRLPAKVRERTDGGEFSPFVRRALVEPHGEQLVAMLRGGRLVAAGLVDEAAAIAVVQRARHDDSLLREVMALASMEVWLRQVEP